MWKEKGLAATESDNRDRLAQEIADWERAGWVT
jgi:hypothetical protein